jgi:hypothetical protein
MNSAHHLHRLWRATSEYAIAARSRRFRASSRQARARRSHAPCDFGAVLALDHSKVMPALQIKPELVSS